MRVLLTSCALVLCGCAVGPDFQSPAAPDTQTYTHDALPERTASAGGTAGSAQAFSVVPNAVPAWWRQFHSEALDRLVDQALRQSPTLDEARAKLIEARENTTALAGSTQFPRVDATLSGTREKVDPAAFGVPLVQNPGPFSLFNASVSVSYVFDIFGGNRRAIEASLAQVDYASYELDAARLSIAGNVVSTAVRRASLQQQITLTQRLADAQARQLSITEARFAAGGVSQLDVRSQRTLLAQTRASEALLHQASANVGVATANLYPQFTLSAGIGSERTNVNDIVNGLNIWNIGLNLTQPIFHGGELHAKKRAAQAAYDAAFASYRQTVLQALQQVADSLTALQSDALELQVRDVAAQEAQASLDIARRQYTAGGISQISLLDAERQALQTSLDRTRAQADRFTDTAALFQALGGEMTDATLGSTP